MTAPIAPISADSFPPAPSRARRGAQWTLLLAALFGFLVGITLLGDVFKVVGHEYSSALLRVADHPLIGFLIGVLATALVQSSSVTTSMIVALVASGELPVEYAVPMVIGANIGTSITNGLVSFGMVARKVEFRRAFAAANVDDIFILITAAVLLPLEQMFGGLRFLAGSSVRLCEGVGALRIASPAQWIFGPASDAILRGIQAHVQDGAAQTAALLTVSIVLLVATLSILVRLLRVLLQKRLEGWLQRNMRDRPAAGILVGFLVTAALQSSSVTTSLLVPLAGVGLLSLEQVLYVTMGARIGTPITALLAALTLGSPAGLTVAFVHLYFGLCGLLMFLALPPMRRLAIRGCEALAAMTERFRFLPLLWIGGVFFALPAAGIAVYELFRRLFHV